MRREENFYDTGTRGKNCWRDFLVKMRGDSSVEELALDGSMDAFPTVRERKAEYVCTDAKRL